MSREAAPIIRHDCAVDRVDPHKLDIGMAHLVWRMIERTQECFPGSPPSVAAGFLLQFNDKQLIEAGEHAYNDCHTTAFDPARKVDQAVMQERELLMAANNMFSRGVGNELLVFTLRNALGAYLPRPTNGSKYLVQ